MHYVHKPHPGKSTKVIEVKETRSKTASLPVSPRSTMMAETSCPSSPQPRLNKFVRRLHNMMSQELDKGVVEWRRGLLVIHSTSYFAKNILPNYFNTRNFKTFRRQLNYYGFVHVRSFATGDHSTTALWVNQALAEQPSSDDIRCILSLKRVEPQEAYRTVEGRRIRKLQATKTIESDIGVKTEDFKHPICASDEEVEYHSPKRASIPKKPSEDDMAASLLLLLSKS